ncbi:PilN family type IVB pilus formation outer membrane protein [Janthinobacterium agaricidamnosum]|uniref:Type IVB pilus formation outer membrane protein, R64 PilN family n=1 Tax=Janthinobacterium agaricidamnosum NBRC 102515 = DSM 9628 TaxID=1349767 RepID=W0V389_9BURK|nr:PilN family type IVB pilus formation outer membrane protein [Janthinobacterium agaricidamnosum]CDG82336.1 type IVB pilus formation outer membrane protein, R64 PilN family [Janthinobacterium agaricidamnosum NBRC 102515 = DSM 9628]
MNRINRTWPGAALFLMLAALGGCSDLSKRAEKSIGEGDVSASQYVKQVGQNIPSPQPQEPSAVEHDSGIWLSKKIVRRDGPSLPPVFRETAIFDRTVYSLQELAERLSRQSGLSVTVRSDAALAAARLQSDGGQANGAPVSVAPGQNAPYAALPPGVPGGAQGNGVPPAPGAANPLRGGARAPLGVRLVHTEGDFKSLLDQAALRFGVSWKYADGGVSFYFMDSHTYQINTFPGEAKFSASVSSGASSSGGVSTAGAGGAAAGGTGGGSDGVNSNNRQNTAVASSLSVYGNVEKTVEALLSPYGKVVSSPATGSITVIDVPEVQQRVAAYIANENSVMSRQIAINVTVLAVSLNDSDEYGINWNLVYNNLSNNYGIKNALDSTTTTGFSAGLLSSASGKFSGSSLLIKALAQQGQVRRQTSATVVTLNNQPVPVQVARQTSYVQSSQTTLTPQVGSATTVTPGTVTTGFNMSILPHILENGNVMLQFSTDISALNKLRPVGSKENGVEVPEVDTRNFLQRVSMKSNQTLIISGFEQNEDTFNQNGIGRPDNFVLGGGKKAAKNKDVIVILVTPTTVSSL